MSAYTIGATGALTPVAGSPFAAGASPNSVKVDPSGKFAYVVNLGTLSESISEYSIDPTTGALTSLGEVRTRGQAESIAMTRSTMPVRYTPRFAYTANIGSNNISGFSINSSTGALAGIAGSPFPSPSSASPAFIATDPKGTLAYAANFSTNNVSGYAISKASGALTPLASPASAGTAPVAIAVDPTGRFVYTANQGSNDTSGFTVDPMTGALTGIAGSPFSVGLGPSAVTIDPAGRYVFVANGSTANISVLGITATDGVLSAVLGSPFAAGTFPRGLAIDPSGKFLYVANSSSSMSTGNYVLGFSIDLSGGLTPVPGSPFAAGLNPVSVAVEPSGRFVYVADNGGSSISAYSLNSTSGALTPITGSPFTIPNFPIALTVDGSGKYVLVGHDGTTGVSVLAIDGTTGGLTPVSGSPFPAATKVFGITSTFTIQ